LARLTLPLIGQFEIIGLLEPLYLVGEGVLFDTILDAIEEKPLQTENHRIEKTPIDLP
jgi:hypothetical protein